MIDDFKCKDYFGSVAAQEVLKQGDDANGGKIINYEQNQL